MMIMLNLRNSLENREQVLFLHFPMRLDAVENKNLELDYSQ
jgi:hypothetical protein